MSVVLIGFMDEGRSDLGDDVLSLGWNERVPSVASVIALLFESYTDDPEAINNLRVDLGKAFDQGARIILCLGPGATEAVNRGVGSWLQSRLGLAIFPGGPWAIRSSSPKLTPWFKERLAYSFIRSKAEGSSEFQVLADAENDEGDPVSPCAVRLTHGKTDVIVLPIGSRIEAHESIMWFLKIVPPRDEYPSYLDALSIGEEATTRERIVDTEKQLLDLRTRIEEAHKVKQILYFTEGNLEHEVVRFLNEYLSIPTQHVTGSDEDLRLVSEPDGEPWCIGEIKGPGKGNVRRPDVGAVMFHRETAGFPEDFPGLLVSNTFHDTRNLDQRDKPVPEDVARLASGNRVLVLRTLDLVRVYQAGVDVRDELLQAIRDGGGGWFEVDKDMKHRVVR